MSTQILRDVRNLPMASLGAPNVLPKFVFQFPKMPLEIHGDLCEDDRVGLLTYTRVPVSPYLEQDNYNRDRQPGQMRTVTLEKKLLRSFTRTSGGA